MLGGDYMIRRAFAQQKVLELYQKAQTIQYPLDPYAFLKHLPIECRMMTYQELSEVSGCSTRDIAVLCGSYAGATHFDLPRQRCLILYNGDAIPGRKLWTQCHEIGHICMEHAEIAGAEGIAHGEAREQYQQMEQEADYFAWNLIAPLPVMREVGIKSAHETKLVFGLSTQAACLHYERFLKWQRSHVKTAWENKMLRLFREKNASIRR